MTLMGSDEFLNAVKGIFSGPLMRVGAMHKVLLNHLLMDIYEVGCQ